LKQHALIENLESITPDEAVSKAHKLGVPVDKSDGLEKVLDNIFKKACRPKLIEPTFVVDYPIASSPLAKKKEGSEELIDRYQLVMGGLELINAFSELNDPIEQRERFASQEENKNRGDEEAQPKDGSHLVWL